MCVSELYLYIFYFFSYGWQVASEQLDLLALFHYYQNNKTIMIFKTDLFQSILPSFSLSPIYQPSLSSILVDASKL